MVYYKNLSAYGTRFDAILIHEDEEFCDITFNEMIATIKQYDLLMNRYNNDSEITLLNQCNEETCLISAELFQLLKTCKHYNAITNGYFDPAILSLINLWNIHQGEVQSKQTPEHSAINNALMATGMNKVHLSENPTSISKPPGLGFDLGAIGKGIVLDNLLVLIQSKGIKHAFINFGDSSIGALGDHPHGEGWEVSIPHPITGESITTFRIKNTCISISGSRKFNLKEEGHTINPQTGYPVAGNLMCIVESPIATQAEVLSTATISCDLAEVRTWLNHFHEEKILLYSLSETDSKLVFPAIS